MPSPFDLSHQNKKIESKIVVALERISEAFRVLLWTESKTFALSPIQIQLLIFINFHPKERCTVSHLAKEFNLTKATVSDSVKLLAQKGLLEKSKDLQDSRSFALVLTTKGKETAEKSAHFALSMEQPLDALTDAQKEAMLSGLLSLIYQLNKTGVITLQRMCYTCLHFQEKKGIPYCGLLQSPLLTASLRIDCPEHEPAKNGGS